MPVCRTARTDASVHGNVCVCVSNDAHAYASADARLYVATLVHADVYADVSVCLPIDSYAYVPVYGSSNVSATTDVAVEAVVPTIVGGAGYVCVHSTGSTKCLCICMETGP